MKIIKTLYLSLLMIGIVFLSFSFRIQHHYDKKPVQTNLNVKKYTPTIIKFEKCGDGKCGKAEKTTQEKSKKKESAKCGEGKCGEGKAGDKATKKQDAKCGNGKCGDGKSKTAKTKKTKTGNEAKCGK